jgi:hypothetical protein
MKRRMLQDMAWGNRNHEILDIGLSKSHVISADETPQLG